MTKPVIRRGEKSSFARCLILFRLALKTMNSSDSSKIAVQQRETEAIVELAGRIIYENLEDAYRSLESMVAAGLEDLFLDMNNLNYLDSSALGMLLSVNNAARSAGTRVTVLSPPKNIRAIFASTRLDHIFQIAEEEDARSIKARFQDA